MRGYKRLAKLVVTASTVISATRLLVLFSESYARVSSERAGDSKLLELCKDEDSGISASDKFRTACVQARASGASPIVLKAILAAINHVFLDFSELASSPTRMIVLVLFVVSGVSAPFVKLVAQTFIAGMRSRTDDEEESDDENRRDQTVLLIEGPQPARGRWNNARRKLAQVVLPRDDYPKVHAD
jgi:hypothetical protein